MSAIGNVGKVGLGAAGLGLGGGIGYVAGNSYDRNPLIGKWAIGTTAVVGVTGVAGGLLGMVDGPFEMKTPWLAAGMGVGMLGGLIASAYTDPAVPTRDRVRIDHG